MPNNLEASLLCSIANRASRGGPVATPDNLKFVQPDWLRTEVEKAVPMLSPLGRKIAKRWLKQPVRA